MTEGPPRWLGPGRYERRRGRWVMTGLAICLGLGVLATLGLVGGLVFGTARFAHEAGLGPIGLIVGVPKVWSGLGPLALNSLLLALGGVAIGGPIGLLGAIALQEVAPLRFRERARPVLEATAALPGLYAGALVLWTVLPVFSRWGIDPTIGAVLALALTSAPLVCLWGGEALAQVPRQLRVDSLALGATRAEVAVRVALPFAGRGLLAVGLLAVARGAGEALGTALVLGTGPGSPGAAHLLTTELVATSMAGHPADSARGLSLAATGLGLLALSWGLGWASATLGRRRDDQ